MRDYTNAKRAPVVIVFVRHNDRYLLVKRSEKVLAYKNLWGVPAGFLDDDQSPLEKAREELREELGLQNEDIIKITEGPVYVFCDTTLGREWERHLIIADVMREDIKIDWEHSEFAWVASNDFADYETTPGFADDCARVAVL